jgi:hypothetical protein
VNIRGLLFTHAFLAWIADPSINGTGQP